MFKLKSLSCALVIVIVMAGLTLASEAVSLNGSITVGGRAVDQEGESAQLNTYSDIDDSVFGSFWADYYQNDNYFKIEGTNVSLDDQSFGLEIGQYETYKFSFSYNEIPHKISMGARTFYTGVGTDTLTYDAADRPKDTDPVYIPNVSTDPDGWNRFDYKEQRKKYEAGLELSFHSPYFVRFNITQDKKTGVKPYSGASSVFPDIATIMVSQFGNIVEMPEPEDYQTLNAILEGGYRSDTLVVRLTGLWSEFDNSNQRLNWRNPYVTTEEFNEESSLPPDNDFYRLAGQMSVQLPYNSILAVRGGYSETKSTYALDPVIPAGTDGIGGPLKPILTALGMIPPGTPDMSPIYAATIIDLSKNTFEGQKEHTTGSIKFRSRPTKSFDYKIHYNYLDRKSDSDVITFTSAELMDPSNIDTVQNTRYGYTKHDAGVSFGYKLPMASQADFGYNFTDTDRDELKIAESTTDHDMWVELMNRYWSRCSGKVKYSHLERSSDFQLGDIGSDELDPLYIRRFVRYFDSTDMSRDAVKIDLNFNVTQNLYIDTVYKYETDDYDETRLGKVKEDNHEVYVDAAWMLHKNISLTGYAGYERKEARTKKRYLDDLPIAPPVSADPNDGTQTLSDPLVAFLLGRDVTAYNYAYEDVSDFWNFAIKANMPIKEDKLDCNILWSYQKNDGEILFTSEGVEQVDDIQIANDYALYGVDTNVIYKVKKHWDVTLGYGYQKYKYHDVQTDGYQYTSTGYVNSYWLTGAYADNEAENHIFYIGTTYTFGDM